MWSRLIIKDSKSLMRISFTVCDTSIYDFWYFAICRNCSILLYIVVRPMPHILHNWQGLAHTCFTSASSRTFLLGIFIFSPPFIIYIEYQHGYGEIAFCFIYNTGSTVIASTSKRYRLPLVKRTPIFPF